jgi:hypothetical protein
VEATTYNAPTIIWRLQRDGVFAYAIIVPRGKKTMLTWWIDDRLEGIDQFEDWTLALEQSEKIRRQLLEEGWTEVT